jgi:hypothetical protein
MQQKSICVCVCVCVRARVRLIRSLAIPTEKASARAVSPPKLDPEAPGQGIARPGYMMTLALRRTQYFFALRRKSQVAINCVGEGANWESVFWRGQGSACYAWRRRIICFFPKRGHRCIQQVITHNTAYILRGERAGWARRRGKCDVTLGFLLITLRFFRATQLGIAASSLHGSTPWLGR